MRKTLFLFVVLTILAPPLSARRYTFKHYTTNDGLVQTDITNSKQDKRGNISIATAGGISFFDGRRFSHYDNYDVLQSLRINAMHCHGAGTMWIATGNGLLRCRDNFDVFLKNHSSRSNNVSCLRTDAKNILHFVCNNTAHGVSGEKVEVLYVDRRVDGKLALLAINRDDNLWLVINDMEVFRKTGDILVPVHTPFQNDERLRGLGFVKIFGNESAEPCFVTNFGTLLLSGDSLNFFAKKTPLYANARTGQATYALQNNDSSVWVGGVAGLSKLSRHNVTRYTAENGLCDNSVSCLFTDREKNLWVGCAYNGVYRLSNAALFQLKPKNESLDLRHLTATVPLDVTENLEFGNMIVAEFNL